MEVKAAARFRNDLSVARLCYIRNLWLVRDSTPSLLAVLRYFRAVSRQQHDIDETESDASATTLLLLLSRRHQQSTPLIPSSRCCRIGYVD